ncbi:MAG: 3-phosphoshikimate 1-carboxyvinyltransferase, partial [Oscillospiraceae bacterium]|nr:3-phosphoshikimate 1-carboxyvinyltransferase [Oscillospiraceae bacterium]
GQTCRSPGNLVVEGDWSNAAFFLAAQALGNEVAVTGLQTDSRQGDRAVVSLLDSLKKGSCVIDCSHIPDLVPILAVAAGALNGAVFTNAQRLRLKESDRIASTGAMLSALGGKWEATDAALTVYPTGYFGGTVDCAKDHRIAMSAAIAASICKAPVTLLGAEAVNKSYPDFWEEYRRLGGIL